MGAEDQAMFVAQQEMEFRVELFNRYGLCSIQHHPRLFPCPHAASLCRMALACFKKCVDNRCGLRLVRG